MLDTWRAAYFINAFGNLFGQSLSAREVIRGDGFESRSRSYFQSGLGAE